MNKMHAHPRSFNCNLMHKQLMSKNFCRFFIWAVQLNPAGASFRRRLLLWVSHRSNTL